MKRPLMAAVTAALLVAMLPAAASADRVTKFTDHHVGASCETPVEGGFVFAVLDSSSEFGEYGEVNLWLDPAAPFEGDAAFSGTTDAIDVSESLDEVVLSATIPVVDADGNDAGEATVVMTLAPDGPPEVIEGDDFGNRNSHTTGTRQPLSGSAEITFPEGDVLTVEPCFGEVADVDVHDTNPHAFTSSNDGTLIDCTWELEGGFAFLFVVDDDFGFFADTGYFTADRELVSTGAAGSIDISGVAASFEIEDVLTGDPYSAEAAAEFALMGDPVTSVLIGQNGREKVVEQRLSVDGALEFSTGDVFALDDEACLAFTFSSHFIETNPSGPKPGPTPVNDTPEGAIPLEPGDRLQVNTTGASLLPEAPITTCPQGPFDDIGHTVWYTIEGTGDEITVDTAGTHFDTVIAVYVMEGDELVEIACVDDVFFEPIGVTFQAAITVPTEEGVTYWIQVGGFRDFFQPDVAEAGRLKLSVE